jgi:hypothetical protein
MNAKSILGFTLAVLTGLALVPLASAQPAIVSATAPVAQASVPGPAALEPGQQAATAPTPMPKVSRFSTVYDSQTPPPPPPPSAVSASMVAPQAPKVQMPMMQVPKGQLVNVKVEFTITDQTGAKPPTKKTMTLIVADKESGRIRTSTRYAQMRGNTYNMSQAPLSVDVMPIIDGGKIRLEFSLEYDLNAEKDAGLPSDAPGPSTNVSERLSAILDSGVPLIIAQSSDAMTDRKLTIEVKATIVK